ncbi:18575_t:CDS:2, partial [Entrophospora sp. SA101]
DIQPDKNNVKIQADEDGPIPKKSHIIHYTLDYKASTLAINSTIFQYFPVNVLSNFGMLHADPKYAYFDRTQYISTLSYFKDPVIIFPATMPVWKITDSQYAGPFPWD